MCNVFENDASKALPVPRFIDTRNCKFGAVDRDRSSQQQTPVQAVIQVYGHRWPLVLVTSHDVYCRHVMPGLYHTCFGVICVCYGDCA